MGFSYYNNGSESTLLIFKLENLPLKIEPKLNKKVSGLNLNFLLKLVFFFKHLLTYSIWSLKPAPIKGITCTNILTVKHYFL